MSDPSAENYSFTNGWTMRREKRFLWHLRDANGDLVTVDQYRNDLISRYKLKIAEHHDPFVVQN